MKAGAPQYARYPSLTGRVVLISGGATGLGAEFVTQFAEQGAEVAFVDIQDVPARVLVQSLVDQGIRAPLYRSVDVGDPAAYAATIREIAAELGPIEVLVNNAADDTRHRSAAVDPQLWHDLMRVNLDHHYFATQAVAPMMRAAGGGSVINLGSISAHIKLTDLVVYRTAKAAIEGLTTALAQQLGGDAIRVNCLIRDGS